MLLCKKQFNNHGCFAATILLYPAPLDRMLGEKILMLVRMMKLSLDAKGGDPNCSKYDEVQP